MADQRIQHTEEMVGAGHPSKDDTLNRITLIQHADDGTHLTSAATLYENTPAGTINTITTGGVFVKWSNSTIGVQTGGDFIVADTGDDDFTIGSSGAGWYDTYVSALIVGEAGLRVTLAIYKNGTAIDSLTRTVQFGGTHEHFATSVDLKIGTLNSGTVSDTASKDENYYDVQEVAEPTGYILDFTFSNMTAPAVVKFAGLYTGSAGHDVEAQIFDDTATVNHVQNGGNAYRCIRFHTSGDAADEPGVGADWESWWELTGAASGEDAWVTSTAYADGFDELRTEIKDLPADTVDYTRSWIVLGSHADRKKYVNSSSETHVRFIHNSSGVVAGNQIKVDQITIDDDHAGASVTLRDIVNLAASDEIDFRMTTNEDTSEVLTTSVNFILNRVKI